MKEIGNIRKCVREFNITVILKISLAKSKIKICEKENGRYVGYTNL